MELLMADLFPDGTLEELAEESVKKLCLECGKSLEQKPTGRPKKFCSDKCRSRWHSKHPAPENWSSTRVALCPQCGGEFLASRETPKPRKYCSRACANRARAKKKQERRKLMGVLYDVAVEGKALKTVGVFTVSNTLAICVHEIDYTDDQVLASSNGDSPKWYPITEQKNKDTGEWEQGFMFSSFFILFSEVMRV
ncbi:MAG: hypothetical protein LUD77_10320 [Clostridiales bacterium]|nr:hypothetical protein [Clostridiales bacterium]